MSHEEEHDLALIRSLINAEESQDSQVVAEAHNEIISKLGASSSSLDVGEPPEPAARLRSQSSARRSEASVARMSGMEPDDATALSDRKPIRASTKKMVSQLLRHKRQRQPLLVSPGDTIQSVAEKLAASRNSAFLVVEQGDGKQQRLAGIATDVDVAKSVANGLSPVDTTVENIMTRNPISVLPTDEAQSAFKLMVKKRFRHLPVVDEGGSICGMVDIAQCLYDGINQLENIQKAQASFVDAVRQTRLRWSVENDESTDDSAVASQLVDSMMSSMAPSVGSLVTKQTPLSCVIDATVVEAATTMISARKTSVLVYEQAGDLHLAGILTTKDILTRVVAKGLDASSTTLKQVMTPDPDTIPSDCSLLDALHTMHDGRYLHVPVEDVVAKDGSMCGVLDVLECAIATFGPLLEKDKSKLSNEFSDLFFEHRIPTVEVEDSNPHRPGSRWEGDSASMYSAGGAAQHHGAASTAPTPSKRTPSSPAKESTMCIKINNKITNRKTRIECDFDYEQVMSAILKEVRSEQEQVEITYKDEDGDEIDLQSERTFLAACKLYRDHGWTKLDVCVRPVSASGKSPSRSATEPTKHSAGAVPLTLDQLKDTSSPVVLAAVATGAVLVLGAVYWLLSPSEPAYTPPRNARQYRRR